MQRIHEKIKKMKRIKQTKEANVERLTIENHTLARKLEKNKREMETVIAMAKKVFKIMGGNKENLP